ncbi:MAG TPA: D-glycero-beta-D-manno-heptose-7-phosphate kinase [Candidatus Margulisiibacteriota bacterium]|nr:D-glycero-beta-D-manno-heptose-7-phosphate kinase [Candidatus Margulisiibacteriota bacterium]
MTARHRRARAAPPRPLQCDALIRRFARARLLVVGDLMLDQFIWGRVERISPEAPVPVVHVTHESFHLGGAANVVHNIRSLGGQATACGVIGRDSSGQRVVHELQQIGAGTAGVVVSRGTVTVLKTRVIAHNQQVVRFDRESPNHASSAVRHVERFLREHAGDFDAVIVSDYGKGVVTAGSFAVLSAARKRHRFRLIVDPKKPNFAHYRGLTLATPNVVEAAEAAGIEIRDEAGLLAAGSRLLERWDAEALLITRGEHGMTLFTHDGLVRHFPTAARQVFDVTGAGDTVVATCALALAAGAHLDEAALLANHAAGVVIGKLGTATLSAAELRKAVSSDQ